MTVLARWRARRDTALQRHIDLALAPEPDTQLEAALQRTYAAEDATRAMATRLDAALDRARLATTARNQALALNVGLTDRVRELGHEVVALRHLLARPQAPRGTDRRCPECQDPMPFGMAHYCRKTSTFREGQAA